MLDQLVRLCVEFMEIMRFPKSPLPPPNPNSALPQLPIICTISSGHLFMLSNIDVQTFIGAAKGALRPQLFRLVMRRPMTVSKASWHITKCPGHTATISCKPEASLILLRHWILVLKLLKGLSARDQTT